MGRRARERPIEEAEIRDTTADGRGVAAVAGKTVFVDAALTGERVRFQRMRRRRNFDEAALVEVLAPAPQRATPKCRYYGVCGGCSLQHLEAGAQLELKQASLLEGLSRIGSVTPNQVLPPLAGEPFGYRRRARLGVRFVEKKGRVLVGFREKHKPYIADMEHCETLVPELARLLAPLAELVASLDLCRQIPQIELSAADNAVALVVRVLQSPGVTDLERLTAFEREHQLQLWLQTGGPGTVQPLVAAAPALAYELPEFGCRLSYGPLDFVQVNQDMNRRMLSQALTLLAPAEGERILDLFCGIGNFSLPLARQGARVTGVELDPVMVGKARDNARANDLPDTEFLAADLMAEPAAVGEHAFWSAGWDTVLLDPPRAGAREVLAAIAATGARRILYVSCHAGTLARDAGILVHDFGFRLQAAGAMDMFPQTSHVEAMALFERTGA